MSRISDKLPTLKELQNIIKNSRDEIKKIDAEIIKKHDTILWTTLVQKKKK